MLRVPSVNPHLDRRIAKLEERLAALLAIPESDKGPDYLGWKEEFLIEQIADLKKIRGRT